MDKGTIGFLESLFTENKIQYKKVYSVGQWKENIIKI